MNVHDCEFVGLDFDDLRPLFEALVKGGVSELAGVRITRDAGKFHITPKEIAA